MCNLELPSPGISVTGALVAEAGQPVSLTCVATVVEYLIVSPTLQWMRLNGSILEEGQNPSAGSSPLVSGTNSTLKASFNPLLASHGGQYLCTASINVSGVPVTSNNTGTSISVQSKLLVFSSCS